MYHDGELAVQTRAGVKAMASRIGRGIHPFIPPIAQLFLLRQHTAIAGTTNAAGQVWASLLMGEPGFLQPLDDQTIRVHYLPPADDPLHENLRATDAIGLLVIDLAHRQRMRVNGRAALLADGTLEIHTQQVYSNCPKYIQVRDIEGDFDFAALNPRQQIGNDLTPAQRAWIETADTCFIATAHPEGGADASHRGGQPGFIKVTENGLLLPDYAGNMMFNTLGNIAANPRVGLLFLDFERGSTLQLTGTARILWEDARIADFPGAQRLLDIQIEQVRETIDAIPVRFRLLEYSPVNPR